MNVADWPLYRYRGTVASITDGDTLKVMVSLGLFCYRQISVRVAGINAPELFSGPPEERTAGAAARDALARLLTDPATGGWRPVYLLTEKDARSFDRWVAWLYVAQPDGTLVDVGQEMVAGGFAVYDPGP